MSDHQSSADMPLTPMLSRPTAADERAAVVRFLREGAALADAHAAYLSGTDTTDVVRNLLAYVADAVERGEHMRAAHAEGAEPVVSVASSLR